MSEAPDVVIAGGGGMGSAAAYFLKALGPPDLKVVVCEPDPTYARASTALAAGGIRQQFSTPENILMSQFGFEFLRNASTELAVDGEGPEVGLHAVPYLRLAAGDRIAALRESYDLQVSLGARSTWLDRDALRARFPWMQIDDVDAAVLGGPREGVFDPYSLVQALRRKALAAGVEYRNSAITGIELDAGNIRGVALADGTRLTCGALVNAAGPWAARVAALAGIELPVMPVRAHTFVFRAERAPTSGEFPVVVDDVQHVNFRPERELFIAGSPREGDLSDAGDNFDVDYGLFDEVIWPLLATRVPAFEAIKMVNAWVGHMEWSKLDANPIIGPHPEFSNFLFVNGFSGHGVQHCPAAGRAIAELIVHSGFQTLDLSRFSFNRVIENRPYIECY